MKTINKTKDQTIDQFSQHMYPKLCRLASKSKKTNSSRTLITKTCDERTKAKDESYL